MIEDLDSARTVNLMVGIGFAAVLGITFGVLVVFGPLSFLAAPIDALNEAFVKWGYEGLNFLLGLGGAEVTEHPASLVVQVLFSTAMPGVIACLLVAAGKGAKTLRRAVSSLLLIAAFTSFIYLPAGEAVALSICAVIVTVILSIAQGLFLTVPLISLATVLGLRYAVLLWEGTLPAIGRGAIQLATFTEGGGLLIWKVALIVAGLIPFFLAAKYALDDGKKD